MKRDEVYEVLRLCRLFENLDLGVTMDLSVSFISKMPSDFLVLNLKLTLGDVLGESLYDDCLESLWLEIIWSPTLELINDILLVSS